MKLLSVNIGQKQTQQKGNEIETTGIYKLPVQEPVEIKSLGIQSDFICDQKNHGGPDQAIYIMGCLIMNGGQKNWGVSYPQEPLATT